MKIKIPGRKRGRPSLPKEEKKVAIRLYVHPKEKAGFLKYIAKYKTQ
jgi:hypothetical protein